MSLPVEKNASWKNTKQVGINLEQHILDGILKVVTSGEFEQLTKSLGVDLTRNADLLRYALTYLFRFPPSQKHMEEIMKWANSNFTFNNFLKKLLEENK